MPQKDPSTEQKIEAVIFASEESVSSQEIMQVLDEKLSAPEIEACVERLNESYASTGRCFRIAGVGGGFRFLTLSSLEPTLKKMLAPKIQRKLSQSALEVLAVIAYQQPVTRGEIQQVRGVSPDYFVNKLLERGLIDVRGRADTPGKPLLYGTTKEFLDFFNLQSLKDLPKLREIKELVQDKEIQDYLSSSEETTFNEET
ncbi:MULTISPECIES: SMC-Scp complex subunit ScpB [Prosthecochloris]|uniref:SMC-Scp complex subunit ScpB n=1 Tax=Prosthecochloris marina TaxID=2017681 RepID=A0A317T928_9CHLB|nr:MULTISPECIES: SMC-Scp complex subunit ScpB [Prosthecochloris]PWW82237.1 SMC-Scp complex subunit ScpB [Prosthecochloris marina]UZJ37184.1 SMC-Scp complex subunit ScpB [Prosthecochloris sp. SCSIO W1103]UZJ38998.1 SMC-Scp complex subunit ScpB [Prosthecochloris sp. SCSIO W1102]